MTEDEWKNGTDHRQMLEFLHGNFSDRKFRLYPCGGCRHLGDLLYHPASTRAIEEIEKTSSVCEMAHHIYESRNFEILPILADALEDAGYHRPLPVGNPSRPRVLGNRSPHGQVVIRRVH